MADDNLQQLAQEYQGLQQQLQMVLVQRQQLAMQQNELEQAQKEAENSNGPFYRFIGSVLVGRDKVQLTKELGEEKAKVVERSALFEAQEKKLSERFKKTRDQLEAYAKKQQPRGAN